MSNDFTTEIKGSQLWLPIHHLIIWKSPHTAQGSVEDFLTWYEKISVGELYEILSEWVSPIPKNLHQIRENMFELLFKWNKQYFMSFDYSVIEKLNKEATKMNEIRNQFTPVDFGNKITNLYSFHNIILGPIIY